MGGVVRADPEAHYFTMIFRSTQQSGSIPGRIWYAVAALIFLAGMAMFTVFLIGTLSELRDELVRVTVPGEAELTLDPGSYTIFHERGGMPDGTGGGIITTDDITGLRISMLKPESGTTVSLTADASSRYTLDGRSGQSLFTFTLTEPGTYRLIAAYGEGRSGSPATLTIAHGFMATLLMTIFAGLAIAFGSFAVAAAMILFVYRRRRSALGPLVKGVSIWKILLVINLDYFTAALLSILMTELLTGLLAQLGFSLPVWPSLLWLTFIVGYFVLSLWLFGATVWQRILKAT
jgi:hypothetical protein